MSGMELEFGGGFAYLAAAYLVCYGLIVGYGGILLVRWVALGRKARGMRVEKRWTETEGR